MTDIDSVLLPNDDELLLAHNRDIFRRLEEGSLCGNTGKAGKPSTGVVWQARKRESEALACWSYWRPRDHDLLHPTYVLP